MKMSVLRSLTLGLLLAICLPSSASALGLGFGAKVGAGSATVNDVDQELTTAMLVANFDLAVVAIEGNLGWHRSATKDADDTFRDEMSAIALAKVGMPIVPAVLSLDFGAGLDQRFHLSTQVGGEEISDVSGGRTLLPLSLQLTGSVLLARLYAEVRYNHELTSTIKVNGVSAPEQNEWLFLLGATF